MRWLIALLLLLVVAAGVTVLVFQREVNDTLGIRTVTPAETIGVVIDPSQVTGLTVSTSGKVLTLTREGGEWTQPGRWPVREQEVAELLTAVTNIRTRYLPIPLGDDLSSFGLAPNDDPYSVDLNSTTKTRLLFGRAADGVTYLRVDDAPEVLRIPPDVFAIVSRPFDTYRRRQLFSELSRVKLNIDGALTLNTVPLPGDTVERIEVASPSGTFTLNRTAANPAPRRDPEFPAAPPAVFTTQLARSWVITTNEFRDRVEPGKLEAALAAVPEMWVEGFPRPDVIGGIAAQFFTSPGLPLDPGAVLRVARPRFAEDLVAELTGLSAERVAEVTPPYATAGGGLAAAVVAARYPQERRVTVQTPNATLTLRIGAVSRVIAAPVPEVPPQPGTPPPADTLFHYAKLDGNSLVFEVRADRFPALFADPATFRDPLVARFTPDEVREIVITIPKHPEAVAAVVSGPAVSGFDSTPSVVSLVKRKGDQFAAREEDRTDRWKIGDRLAEPDKVTELLDALSKLEAKTPADRIDSPGPHALDGYDSLGGLSVKVTARANVVEGDTEPPAREYDIDLAARDPDSNKLAVRLAGWPGIKLVDDTVVSLADRGPLVYRSRRLFDTAEMKLARFSVTKADGSSYTLVEGRAAGQPRWTLTAPLSVPPDETKATSLADALSGLQAVEYIDETPSAEKLAGDYELEKPRFVVDLTFEGTGGKQEQLRIGAPRSGKEEAFARLSSGGVFTVSNTLVDALAGGPLELLPLELWATTADKVRAVTITRNGAPYTVRRDGAGWKLSGPFDAAASGTDADPLATALAAPKAERYVAVTADPVKHGLTPGLRPLLAVAGGLASDAVPSLTLTVEAREQGEGANGDQVVTRTLVIGNPTAPPTPASPFGQPPAPGRYAKFEDGPNQAVFVLPDATISPADKPPLDWLNRDLLSLDPTKVTEMTISGQDTVTLTRGENSAWTANGFDPDRELVGNLLFTATNLPVVRLVAYGPNVDWAEYGLDPPALTLTITSAGASPEAHMIKLGKELPSGERYVRVDDSPAVGVISGAADSALARGKFGLADRSLLTFNPVEVISLTRTGTGGEFELVAGLGWDVVKPTKFKADEETVLDLLERLSRGRAVRVEAIQPNDTAKYGLMDPVVVILLVGLESPKTLTLRIGSPVDPANPASDRFVQTASNGPVKVLAGDVANKLLAEPVKFKDKLLNKFVDADKVSIARGDRTAVFAKVDGSWKMTAPAEADADQAALDALIAAAATLRADELVAEKPADLKPYGLDTPTAMVTFFNAGQEVQNVLVGKTAEDGKRSYGKLKNGDAVVLFGQSLSAKLLSEYRSRAVWSGVDASQVQALAVSGEGANFAFTKQGTTWIDPAKPESPPDQTKVTDTLATMAGLKAERFVADKDADLKLYGLVKPSRVIVFSQQGGEIRTLHLGGEVGGTDGKQVYAKVGDPTRTDVFVLSEQDTRTLMRDRTAYSR